MFFKLTKGEKNMKLSLIKTTLLSFIAISSLFLSSVSAEETPNPKDFPNRLNDAIEFIDSRLLDIELNPGIVEILMLLTYHEDDFTMQVLSRLRTLSRLGFKCDKTHISEELAREELNQFIYPEEIMVACKVFTAAIEYVKFIKVFNKMMEDLIKENKSFLKEPQSD